jgi:glycosyltransferase involved in cell wall biosynthesis
MTASPQTIAIDSAAEAATETDVVRHLTFCVLTYQRPIGLSRALRAIAALDAPGRTADATGDGDPDVAHPVVDVLVVDNDPAGGARGVVDRVVAETGLSCRYVVESQRGITYARNRAVREAIGAGADWIAWLDDDEAPRPSWLRRVLATQTATGADVVMGPSSPVFDADARPWIVESGAFAHEHFTTGASYPFFYTRTSGVIVRTDALPPEGFDDRLALTGGEDRVLFTRMHRAGATFVWDDDAVVDEWIPTSRVSVGWLVRRWFRTGVTRSLTLLYLDTPRWPRRLRRVAGGLVMALRGLVGVVAAVPQGRSQVLMRSRLVLLGLGAAHGALGLHFREYRKVHGS